MSWTDALAALKTNCTTAAADVTPAIPLVRVGEPDGLNQDMIALWPVGTRAPGDTYTRVHLERGVQVTAYLRGSTRAGVFDAALEARLVAIEEALFTRLWADDECGGNAVGITIDSSTYGWEVIGDQLARSVTFTVWVWLASVATVSP